MVFHISLSQTLPISKQELETIDIIESGSKQMELIDFDKIDNSHCVLAELKRNTFGEQGPPESDG